MKRWRARGKSRSKFECGHRGFGAFCHRCKQGDKLLGVKLDSVITVGHELSMGAGGGAGHPVTLYQFAKIESAKKRESAKTQLEKRGISDVHCADTVARCHAEGERLIRTGIGSMPRTILAY